MKIGSVKICWHQFYPRPKFSPLPPFLRVKFFAQLVPQQAGARRGAFGVFFLRTALRRSRRGNNRRIRENPFSSYSSVSYKPICIGLKQLSLLNIDGKVFEMEGGEDLPMCFTGTFAEQQHIVGNEVYLKAF